MKTAHILMISTGWVLGTFALHCWVLYPVAGLPNYQAARTDFESGNAMLSRAITSPEYASAPDKQAQEIAAMKGRDVKLWYALSAHDAAENKALVFAANADTAGSRIVRRAWIFWLAVAFTPLFLFALGDLRSKRLANKPPPGAAPNGGPYLSV